MTDIPDRQNENRVLVILHALLLPLILLFRRHFGKDYFKPFLLTLFLWGAILTGIYFWLHSIIAAYVGAGVLLLYCLQTLYTVGWDIAAPTRGADTSSGISWLHLVLPIEQIWMHLLVEPGIVMAAAIALYFRNQILGYGLFACGLLFLFKEVLNITALQRVKRTQHQKVNVTPTPGGNIASQTTIWQNFVWPKLPGSPGRLAPANRKSAPAAPSPNQPPRALSPEELQDAICSSVLRLPANAGIDVVRSQHVTLSIDNLPDSKLPEKENEQRMKFAVELNIARSYFEDRFVKMVQAAGGSPP